MADSTFVDPIADQVNKARSLQPPPGGQQGSGQDAFAASLSSITGRKVQYTPLKQVDIYGSPYEQGQKTLPDYWKETHKYLFGDDKDQPQDHGVIGSAWNKIKDQPIYPLPTAAGAFDVGGGILQETPTQLIKNLRDSWQRFNNRFAMSDEEMMQHQTARDTANKAADDKLGTAGKIGRFALEGAEDTLEGFTSPANIALMFTGYGEAKLATAIGKDAATLLGRLASTYWTSQMLLGTGEDTKASFNAFVNGDYETGIKAAVGGLVNGFMAGHSLTHQVAQERVARDLDKKSQELYGHADGMSLKGRFAQLNPQQQAHVVYEATKNMPLQIDLGKEEEQYGPNKKRQKIIDYAKQRGLEAPPNFSDAFNKRLDEKIASEDAFAQQQAGLNAYIDSERNKAAQRDQEAKRLDDHIEEKQAQKRPSEEAPQELGFPVMSDQEREYQRHQYEAEQAKKTLEREQTEALRMEEDRKSRQRLFEAQAAEDAAAQQQEMLRNGQLFTTVDRRANAGIREEMREALRAQLTPERDQPELASYVHMGDQLRQDADNIYPGADPAIVNERLRAKEREGYNLSQYEQDFRRRYELFDRAERGLASNKEMSPQAYKMVEAMDRQHVEDILALAKREEDLMRTAEELTRQANVAATPEAADEMAERAIQARMLAAEIRSQRRDVQATRAANTDDSVQHEAPPISIRSGSKTRIDLQGRTNTLAARYGAVRLSDLKLSHDPFSFQWKDNYWPRKMQPRDLSTNKVAQNAIIIDSQPENYKHDRYMSDNTTATEGPAVILPDGRVAGGNSRLARLIRALRTERRGEIVTRIYNEMEKMGIDTEGLYDFDDPYVPVRILDSPPQSREELIKLGDDLNQDPSIMGFSGEEKSVMSGERLQPEDMEKISAMLDGMPESATLRDMLTARTNDIVDMMIGRGIIPENKLAEYVTKDGLLTEPAKLAFEQAIMGKVIDDPDLLATVPRGTLEKVERALPALLKIKSGSPEWNVSDYFKESLRIWRSIDSVSGALRDIGTADDSMVDKYFRPQNFKMGTGMLTFQEGTLREPPHPITEAFAKLLEKTSLNVKRALDNYAADVEGRQDYLMGQPSPVEAFNKDVAEKVGVTVDPTEWGTLRPTSEATKDEARKAALPPDLPKTPASPKALEPPPGEKAADKPRRPVEPSPKIVQPTGSIEIPLARLERATASAKGVPESELKSGRISRTVDIDGRPFVPVVGADKTTRLIPMFTPEEWGNRPTNQPGETAGKVVRHKGREWILGGPDSEAEITPGPDPVDATNQIVSAIENGTVTPQSLRRLFESDSRTADAASELMDVFTRTIPRALNMTLDDFLRKFVDVRFEAGEGKDGIKGETQFLDDGRALIKLFEGSDPTTVMHEFFHVMRRYLNPEDLKVLEKFAGVKDGIWETDHEEKVARAWERYHYDGKAPTSEVAGIFEKLKNVFRDVYQSLKGSPLVRVPESLRQVFDRWYGAEPEPLEPPPGHDKVGAGSMLKPSDLSPFERENSKLIAHGGADISQNADARLMRFDHPDEAQAFGVNHWEKLKGIQVWQTKDGKAYALLVPRSPNVLFQREPENMQDAIRRLDQLKRQRASETDLSKLVPLSREIDRLEGKYGLGSVLNIGLQPPPNNAAKPGELERPPEMRRPEPPVSLFPDVEVKRGRDTDTLRTVHDGPVRVPERAEVEGVAGRGGERRLAPSDRGSLLPVPEPRAAGSSAARGIERNTFSGTTPNRVAAPIRPRGQAIVDGRQWRERMDQLRMPIELPPPTVTISPRTALLLRYAGQREAVESVLSALQQYDGAFLATPPGTGKTYMELAAAKELFQPGHKQLIITRNNDIITQRKGFRDVGKKIFNMEVKKLPADVKDIGEGIYATTYATLRERVDDLAGVKWNLIIPDEAGEARRWWESAQGGALHKLSDSAEKMIYGSATPFHTALEIGYAKKLGLWDDVGFDDWARQFGVRKSPEGKYSGGNSPKKLLKLRQQLVERGQLVHIGVNYDGFRAEFAQVPLTEEHVRGIQNIRQAFSEMENYFQQRGKPQLAAAVRGNGVNYMKNYLERIRLPRAIEMARKLHAQGWQVAFFSEHNQERAEVYDFAKEADRAMGGRISALLPKLPGVYDTLHEAFGEDVANFSGSFSATRRDEKNAFLDAKKPYLFATYGAGGVGVSLHDDSGVHPRAAIYLGPPWSGIMLDQALGREWRYGTKSNVHAIFMTSNAKPEVNMMLTKIAPRMEALRAAIAGIDGTDPLVQSMRQLERTRDELANYEMGGEQRVDISDFDFLQDNVPINNYQEVGIVDAENAKNKGMRYAVEPDENPGVITLFQEGEGLNVPTRFKTPDEHTVEKYVESVGKDLAVGNPVPGAPNGIQDMDTADRTLLADAIGPTVQQTADMQIDGDKPAAARMKAQAEIATILGVQRAGQVKLDPESQEWSMTYPLGEATAKKQNSEEVARTVFAISGRQQIEAQAGMAGRPEIGRELHRKIMDYHATSLGWAGRKLSEWYKFKKEIGGISAKEFKLAVMAKEGKVPTSNAKTAKIVAKLTSMFNDIRQEMEDNDIENRRYVDGKPSFVTFADIQENPNYWPRRYNMAEKIKVTDPTTGETETFTLAQLVGGTLAQARRNRIIAAISREQGISTAEVEDWLQKRQNLTPVRGNIERSRQANMPFYRTDEAALLEYLSDAGEVLARKEVFGQNREKWDGLVAQIPNAKARQTINNIVGTLLSPHPWANTRFQQIYRKFTAATVMMKMTMSTVKLPGHLAHITLVQGQVRHLLMAMMKAAASPREARERALFAGSLSRETVSHAVTEEGLDKGFANRMLHYTGFHAAYNVDRIIANLAAQGWMEKTALPKLIKGVKNSDYYRRQLRDVYLLSDDAIDAAIKNKRFTKEDIDRGGVALTNKTLFVNEPTELPHWLRPNSPDASGQNRDVAIRAAMVLKGFTFRTTALLKERLIDEWRQGNYRAWVPLLLAYPAIGAALRFAGAAVHGGVQALNPENKDKNAFDKYMEEWDDMFTDPSVAKFARAYIEDLGLSAGLDFAARVFNTIVFPVEDKRKRRQQTSYLGKDILEYLAGPEYSQLYDTFEMGSKMLQTVQSDSEQKGEKIAQAVLDYVRQQIPAARDLLPKKMQDIYQLEPFPGNR